jgi:hypothetical protein
MAIRSARAEHESGAALRKQKRRRFADAAARAGDDCG